MKKGLSAFATLIVLMFVTACGSEKDIVIDRFRDFPDEINGCACYYAADKADFAKGSYIYADNYHDHAYVSVNGKMLLFTLISTTDVAEGYWVKTYSNNEYQLTIDSKEVWQVNQTWQQKGTMVLTSKDGKTIKETIYGECGC